MKISKRQLKRIIREEKQKLMTETVDLSVQDRKRRLLMSLLDAMQRTKMHHTVWSRMLEDMGKIGPANALEIFERAVHDLKNNVDPNDYA